MNDLFNYYKNKTLPAIFVRRPHRFAAECLLDGQEVLVHLPNPGRMWELLQPGRQVHIIPSPADGRKTKYRLAGFEQDGIPVLGDTQFCNSLAAALLENDLIPGWEGWRVEKTEVSYGHSRFDLLLIKQGQRMLVEVKNTTRFSQGVGLFPDSVSARASKHMTELTKLAKEGVRTGVLFLVQWGAVDTFIPDYHTDLAFARTFLAGENTVEMKAIALDWQRDFSLNTQVRELAIPWELLHKEVQDGGCYLLGLHLAAGKEILVGKMGMQYFPPGFYVYAGSARQHLTQRLARHARKRKKFHWHIDYFRQQAQVHVCLPIRTTFSLEQELAAAVSELADWNIPNFGCTDCRSGSHLFGFHADPLIWPPFLDLLHRFRLYALEHEYSR